MRDRPYTPEFSARTCGCDPGEGYVCQRHQEEGVNTLTDSGAFVTKDSGERKQFASGMQRDTTTGKSRPDLVRSGPMFQRWVGLMTRGAQKYDANNWMKAQGREEEERFLESAARHFEVWFMWRRFGINIEDPNHPTRAPLTEDHAAAVFFNINGVEYVRATELEGGPVRNTKEDFERALHQK